MRIYDDLLQWIVEPHRLLHIDGDILQQAENGRDSGWMDTVLRFLKTEDALGFRIELQSCQREETECSI
jgi:hypothetical protein